MTDGVYPISLQLAHWRREQRDRGCTCWNLAPYVHAPRCPLAEVCLFCQEPRMPEEDWDARYPAHGGCATDAEMDRYEVEHL